MDRTLILRPLQWFLLQWFQLPTVHQYLISMIFTGHHKLTLHLFSFFILCIPFTFVPSPHGLMMHWAGQKNLFKFFCNILLKTETDILASKIFPTTHLSFISWWSCSSRKSSMLYPIPGYVSFHWGYTILVYIMFMTFIILYSVTIMDVYIISFTNALDPWSKNVSLIYLSILASLEESSHRVKSQHVIVSMNTGIA